MTDIIPVYNFDPINGDDLSGDGSEKHPFQTIDELRKYVLFHKIKPCILRCNEYIKEVIDIHGQLYTQ